MIDSSFSKVSLSLLHIHVLYHKSSPIIEISWKAGQIEGNCADTPLSHTHSYTEALYNEYRLIPFMPGDILDKYWQDLCDFFQSLLLRKVRFWSISSWSNSYQNGC